jgi:hypothetical protein
MGVEKIACPESIPVSEPRLLTPIPGWTAINEESGHKLSSISFYDGPVEEGASLVPDRNIKAQKIRTATWQLDPKNGRGYWLACHYSGTTLTLGRALPKGLVRCAVTYNDEEQIEGLPVVENLSCQ